MGYAISVEGMVFGGSKNNNNMSMSGLSCVGVWKNLFLGVWGGVS